MTALEQQIAQIGGRVDLHVHSKASDGTCKPEEIADEVKEKGLLFFALTDHDTYEGGMELLSKRPEEAGRFVLGIELSCKDELGKYHILGYRFDPNNVAMMQIVEEAHDTRIFKVLNRIRILREQFGFTFTTDEIDELMANPNPGKPHIANLMLKHHYAKERGEAIGLINRCRVKSRHLTPERAIGAITEAGGIAVLAHSYFGDGAQNLTLEEVKERVKRFEPIGLQGLECFYSRYTEEQRLQLLAFAQERGLYVTAGSDYHGSNKKVVLGDTGLMPDDTVPEGLTRFLEAVIGDAERWVHGAVH